MKKSHCTSRAVFLFCFSCDARSMQAAFADLTNANVWYVTFLYYVCFKKTRSQNLPKYHECDNTIDVVKGQAREALLLRTEMKVSRVLKIRSFFKRWHETHLRSNVKKVDTK